MSAVRTCHPVPMPHGAIGSTSDFDSEGSTFESWWGIQFRKCGRVWFNAPVLKTDVPRGTVGSNPTTSAIIFPFGKFQSICKRKDENIPEREVLKCQGKKLGTFFILGLDNFFVSRYSENID